MKYSDLVWEILPVKILNKIFKKIFDRTNVRSENIGSVYRSSDTHNIKFIEFSWITFVYVCLRFERIFSHHRAKWKFSIFRYCVVIISTMVIWFWARGKSLEKIYGSPVGTYNFIFVFFFKNQDKIVNK